jgi:hypothetical protein
MSGPASKRPLPWDLAAIIQCNMSSNESQVDIGMARDVMQSVSSDAQVLGRNIRKYVHDMGGVEYKRKVLNAVRKDDELHMQLWFVAEANRLSKLERAFIHQCDWWMAKEDAPEVTIERALKRYIRKLTRVQSQALKELQADISKSLGTDEESKQPVDFQDPADIYCRQVSMTESFRWYGFDSQLKMSENCAARATNHAKFAMEEFRKVKSASQRRIIGCPKWLDRMGLRRGKALRYPLPEDELENIVDRVFPRTESELEDRKFVDRWL